MKTNDIGTIITALCEHGARAVQRYVEISGVGPGAMPEYFMPAFIFDHMGDQVTMTLETNFLSLLEWNMHAKNGRRVVPSAADIKALSLAADLGSPRVDLAIFADPHRPKDEQDILALVEFKRGWISAEGGDRDKLLLLLNHIDSCKYGAVCGWTDKPEYPRGEAQKFGDLWFEHDFELHGRHCFFCARVFEASAAKRSG
jgi:hypothetical protein